VPPAAKSTDRVLNFSDAGNELHTPAQARQKGRILGSGRQKGWSHVSGDRQRSVHELSRQADRLTGDDRGNGPIGSICPPQQGHWFRALSEQSLSSAMGAGAGAASSLRHKASLSAR
jgi:hypothetical protein